MVIELRHTSDLDNLIERSHTNPVLILKHSTQCFSSGAALDEFREFLRSNPDAVHGVIYVPRDRVLATHIAERFNIRHESPQAILLVDGNPVWNASHWRVTSDAIRAAFEQAATRQ